MTVGVEASSKLRPWSGRKGDGYKAPEVVPGVPVDLSHSIDQYGSLVTVGAADWYVGFVPGLQPQWWHHFVNGKHKHVFAIRPLDTGEWVLVESWWTRLWVTVLPASDAIKFLRWGPAGSILKVRESIPGQGSQLRGWANCAVLAAFVLGRKSKSWTPHGLYEELVKDGAKAQDIEELLIEQFVRIVDRHVVDGLRVDANLVDAPLDHVLEALGRNILAAILSPPMLGLCFAAMVEAERFPRAARMYHEHGLKPAIDKLVEVLERGVTRGQARIQDRDLAAREFLAMLRGNVQIEAALGLREAPSSDEIEARVSSAVRTFLRGVGRQAGA